MPQTSLSPNPTRTKISLDVAGDLLPVRLVSDPPGDPTPPSERLRHAFSQVWLDVPTRVILVVTLFILGGALVITSSFSGIKIMPEQTAPSPLRDIKLGYIAEHPFSLVVHEDEQFFITLINRGSASLTHVSATLVFSDALPIRSDTTVVQFEDLAPGERKTRTIHFTLKQYAAPSVQAELRASADQFGNVALETYTLNIAPFPRVKTIRRWLVGSLYTGLGGILLWALRSAFKEVLPG